MPLTLVLNSHHFLEGVFPGTIQELAGEEVVSQLFRAIRDNGHRILVTDRVDRRSIKREYVTELRRRGLEGFVPQLQVVFDQLESEDVVVVRSNVARINIPNLTVRHQIFLEDAVAARVHLFITQNEGWLRLNRDRQICPDLEIMNADQFVKIAGETS